MASRAARSWASALSGHFGGSTAFSVVSGSATAVYILLRRRGVVDGASAAAEASRAAAYMCMLTGADASWTAVLRKNDECTASPAFQSSKDALMRAGEIANVMMRWRLLESKTLASKQRCPRFQRENAVAYPDDTPTVRESLKDTTRSAALVTKPSDLRKY